MRKTGLRRLDPHPLAAGEVELLLAACKDGWVGTRDRAIVTVLWRAGLRSAEALALRLDDIRRVRNGGVVRVTHPKGYARGAMPREVGIDSKALGVLDEWLELRGARPGWLFPSRQGQQIHVSYLRKLLPRLAHRAGVRRRVHPHALRHTFARELYDEGVGLMEIMLALGHNSLSTTQTYLVSIGATQVVAVTTRREW